MDDQKAIIRVTRADQILLEYQAVDSAIDPGHWRLPVVALNDPVSPLVHSKLCGLPLEVANALAKLLSSLQLSFSDVKSINAAESLCGPQWASKSSHTRIVDVVLYSHSRPSASHQEGRRCCWRDRKCWVGAFESGELLLNPLSRAFIENWPAIPNCADWASEEPLPGLVVIPVRSHTLPPASHTNAFLLGDGEKSLIDPSPADEKSYAALTALLGPMSVSKIVISHHHPDHHQQVPRLARELGVPVYASEDTLSRISMRFGTHYWDDIDTRTLIDGCVVTECLGRPVHAHSVPGHDAGQMAFAPNDMSWMIVGDLIQGIGTVVIAEPEGDMAAYFASLRWVIEMNPKVIIPSHGQAMGSCFRIEETLRHRLQREADVLAMHEAGLSVEDMLAKLYANVDRRLWGLARMNIQSHLKKLRNEGRLQS